MAKEKNKRENHQTKRSFGLQASLMSQQKAKSKRSPRRFADSIGDKMFSTAGDSKRPKSGAEAFSEDAARRGSKDLSRNSRQTAPSSVPPDEFGSERFDTKDLIFGRNPVTEALKSDRDIDRLLACSMEGSMIKITAMAKERGIPIIKVDKVALDRMAGGQAHQGVAAYISPYKYVEIEDIFASAKERNEEPLIVILDGLEDPHNLGAIMRTAECAGAHGIIIPKRRACGLTQTVAKASAGAIEYMPCARVTNIVQTMEQLKEQGLWIAACDMGGESYYSANLKGPLAVVIGSEGFGVSKLVRERCDFVVSMPMVGKISSLNASNAAAVLLYEVRKQRDGN